MKFPYESAAQAIAAALEHHRAGRLAEADQIYRQILVREPNQPDALHLLGVVYGQSGQPQVAVDLISRAIKLRPDVALFHSRLAEFLRMMRRHDDAIASYRRAISLAETDAGIHNNFGAALGEMRQFDAAIVELRRAVELKPDYADAHSNLGAALVAVGQLDAAIASLQTALRLNPNLSGAFNNLGNALYGQGEIEQAITAFNKVVSFKPNDPKIHANLALAYLILGDYPQGWREHEWRLQVPAIVGIRQFTQPRWDGSDLNGKTILLHPEQGFGDMIQFARYIPFVAERGGRIILESPPELFELFKDFPNISEIIQRDARAVPPVEPPLPQHDVHCPLVSLGYVFNTTVETIPSEIPYLKADPARAHHWASRFNPDDTRHRVGLVWGGRPEHTNERNRSMTLAQFAPLAVMENIALYSLQKGPAAAQTTAPPPGLQLIDWTADLTNFAETAALIENLDLILTVDTAVAHLAGAMGKRVWLLLPRIPDWRWLLDRPDSPWYPKIQLFRQNKIGDWPGVLQRVCDSIKSLPADVKNKAT